MKKKTRKSDKMFLIFTSCLFLISAAVISLILTFTPKPASLSSLYAAEKNISEREKNKIVILTLRAPKETKNQKGVKKGFDYEIISAFAKSAGKLVEVRVMKNMSSMLESIKSGEADIAAGVIKTPQKSDKFTFGPEYESVQQQVVCGRKLRAPANLAELTQLKLEVSTATGYEDRLNELKIDVPALNWKSSNTLNPEQLLEKVSNSELDCTVADSNLVAINRRYYPEIEIAFPLTYPQSLAWLINDNKPELKKQVEQWFAKFKATGKLAEIEKNYHDHVEVFDYVDTVVYHKRIRKRLPQYKDTFVAAANEYSLAWTLLAAQAYQESHWDELATSPTGVRGLMMLTKRTAKELGISNRLNSYQSIMGGAKYLAYILESLPESLQGENRLRYALAAYNIGMGHMRDARKLARRFGKNPDDWNDLKTVLPLLAQEKYYKNLRYGYARGKEPVHYVERILNYRDILQQQNLKETRL